MTEINKNLTDTGLIRVSLCLFDANLHTIMLHISMELCYTSDPDISVDILNR